MNIKAKFLFSASAIKLCQLLVDAGGEARFIGGCVRDSLMNRVSADIDIATNLLPEKIEQILEENQIKYYNIGKKFGTITAVIAKQQFEITTLRKDLNCDGRYAELSFTNNWQEDAQRRDFTINALSVDLEGNLYDYFNGLADLQHKIVRFIGNAEERITEDYLRILRFFRFSSYFAKEVDQTGLIAASKYARNLKEISGARIKSELEKIFIASNGIEIIEIMFNHGILEDIFPFGQIYSLKKLHKNAIIFNYPLNELLCFAVLLKNSQTNINFPFTRSEKKILNQLINSQINGWTYDDLKQVFQKYKQSFKEVILLNLENYNEEIIANCKKLFNMLIQALPIAGEDLIKLNLASGEEIGKLLLFADKIWYAQEFAMDKDELLKRIVLHVNKF